MDLTQLPLFGLLKEKMNFLSEQQKAISNNLANADTPGYRAETLKEPDFSAFLNGGSGKTGGALQMATTDAKHIPTTLGGVSPLEAAIHGHGASSPDGNSVDVSEQVMKLADTQLQYNLATNIYGKHVQLLRLALGRGGQ